MIFGGGKIFIKRGILSPIGKCGEMDFYHRLNNPEVVWKSRRKNSQYRENATNETVIHKYIRRKQENRHNKMICSNIEEMVMEQKAVLKMDSTSDRCVCRGSKVSGKNDII